jgi:general secretion pathway protein B
MSYILDALKKAESERKLGSVPNVYMEPLPIARSDEPVTALRRTWIWIWIAVALLAVAGTMAMWMNAVQEKAGDTSSSASPMTVASATPATPVSAEGAGISAPPDATRADKPAQKKETESRANKKAVTAHNVTPTGPVKAPAQTDKERTAKEPGQQHKTVRDIQPAKPAARVEPEKKEKIQPQPESVPPVQQLAAEPPVAALHDLPDHIRRSIPTISVGGYIYSANPAERSMLLNNRLVREGEQVASGVILEKMMPKEAVLNYQGQRFRLQY